MSPCAVPENAPDRNYSSDMSSINSFVESEAVAAHDQSLQSCHGPGPLEKYLSAEGLKTENGTLRYVLHNLRAKFITL